MTRERTTDVHERLHTARPARSDGESGQNRREEGFICQTPVTTKGGNTTFFWEERETILGYPIGRKGKQRDLDARLFLIPSWEGRDAVVSRSPGLLCSSWSRVLIFNNCCFLVFGP